MADNKISELPAITGANLADADEFVVVDSSSAQTNRITRAELANGGFTSLNVTGTITSDGLTVDGVASLNADITQTSVSPSFYIMDSNTTDLNDRFVNAGGTIFLQTVNDAKSTFKSRFSVNNSTGDISFYEDTGTTAKFFWDASAESLGIGTTSPSSALHISAANNSQLFIAASDTNPTTAIFETDAGTSERIRLNNKDGDFTVDVSNTTEAMRIDSSGNLLVGQTVGNVYNQSSVTGLKLDGTNGNIQTARANNVSLLLNRYGTDGGIASFYKDGSTVGSIGTNGGRLSIGSGDVNLNFNASANSMYPISDTSGTLSDGVIDVGASTARFKDLYLSGGIEIEEGTGNVGVGKQALNSNTASYNTGVGALSLFSNTTASKNTAVGYTAMYANTTGQENAAFAKDALQQNTSGSFNTAVGHQALASNSIASYNTSAGHQAGYNNSTASYNTYVGYQAGYSNSTGQYNTFVGKTAGYYSTSSFNTYIGHDAGLAMTSGSKNTILGRYSGNQSGLDLRTASNYIVLSDGDGNPRVVVTSGGDIRVPQTYNTTTGNAANMYIDSFGNHYRSTSSARYKNTVNDATHGLTELLTLRPVTYKGNNDGDTVFGGLIAEEVHDAGLTEFVQYDTEGRPDALAYGQMVSLCIKAIQEQQATIEALEARITQLESN